MTAYYNENDPKAAAWLRELIKEGLIAPGDVDERSILDVRPHELTPYTQHHFFAGIGGWSYALRLAGVPDHFPVWTGSCPCQPFADCGKGLGFSDPRHLWPVWSNLIRERHPSIVIGEQVASPAALMWLDLVFSDLEEQKYACAAADLPAAGVGSPQGRPRIYFLASSMAERPVFNWQYTPGSERVRDQGSVWPQGAGADGVQFSGEAPLWRLPDADNARLERPERHGQSHQAREERPPARCKSMRSAGGLWPPGPREIGSIPVLVDGLPGGMGRCRGYGNAIVPQVAAVFIEAALDAIETN